MSEMPDSPTERWHSLRSHTTERLDASFWKLFALVTQSHDGALALIAQPGSDNPTIPDQLGIVEAIDRRAGPAPHSRNDRSQVTRESDPTIEGSARRFALKVDAGNLALKKPFKKFKRFEQFRLLIHCMTPLFV